MRIDTLALSPAPSVTPRATVLQAVRVMQKANSGAVVVLDAGRLAGVVTERDVMLRVVAAELDPAATRVRAVMTKTVRTLAPDADVGGALAEMVTHGIRHLVVVDRDGAVTGLVSARHLFRAHVESLDDAVRSLEAFTCAETHGG